VDPVKVVIGRSDSARVCWTDYLVTVLLPPVLDVMEPPRD